MTALNSDLKLLDDQDIQRFIMDGMLSFHPDVSSETHEEFITSYQTVLRMNHPLETMFYQESLKCTRYFGPKRWMVQLLQF